MITICRKASFYEQFKLGNSSFFEEPLRTFPEGFAKQMTLLCVIIKLSMSSASSDR